MRFPADQVNLPCFKFAISNLEDAVRLPERKGSVMFCVSVSRRGGCDESSDVYPKASYSPSAVTAKMMAAMLVSSRPNLKEPLRDQQGVFLLHARIKAELRHLPWI